MVGLVSGWGQTRFHTNNSSSLECSGLLKSLPASTSPQPGCLWKRKIQTLKHFQTSLIKKKVLLDVNMCSVFIGLCLALVLATGRLSCVDKQTPVAMLRGLRDVLVSSMSFQNSFSRYIRNDASAKDASRQNLFVIEVFFKPLKVVVKALFRVCVFPMEALQVSRWGVYLQLLAVYTLKHVLFSAIFLCF